MDEIPGAVRISLAKSEKDPRVLVAQSLPAPPEPRSSLPHTKHDDDLPAYCHARLWILGVGNTLFGNDGFGPAVSEALLEKYVVPEDTYIADAGLGVPKLLATLFYSDAATQEVLIVDAVDWGQGFGHILEIPAKELPDIPVQDFSIHQAPTSKLLRAVQDQKGVKVTAMVCDVGYIPAVVEPGLSPAIRSAVDIACRRIAEQYRLRPR